MVQIVGVRVLIWSLSFFVNLEAVTWDDSVIEVLNFVGEYVLQVPLFFMTLMRHLVPTLDNL